MNEFVMPCPMRSLSEIAESAYASPGKIMRRAGLPGAAPRPVKEGAKKRGQLVQRSHADTMAKMLRENARRHRLHKVFSDFCELAALAVSNSVDSVHREVREARYMHIVGGYERDEVHRFAHLLTVLVDWLECGLDDCLGKLFMGLELGDSFKGQFFTPFEISRLMAGITFGGAREAIERQGFVTVNEPACGSGGMLLAVADVLQVQGINYQQAMHATAVDVDATAVHMTYLQLSLAHVPAIIVHGNSLSLAEWSHWFTPAHIVGGWNFRLRAQRQHSAAAVLASEMPEAAPAVQDLAAVRASFVQHEVSHG